MKTSNAKHQTPRWLCLGLLAGSLLQSGTGHSQTNAAATASGAAEAEKTEADYRNWIEFGLGGTFIDGDETRFMQRTGIRRDVFGGIEALHFEQDVGKRGIFTLDGRAIYDNHDYSIRLGVDYPDLGFVRTGYREYRTWYDGSGGFFPRNDAWFEIFDEQLAIDRKEAFFEAGLRLPDVPQVTFRYTYQVRDGDKNSTVWGDSNLTGGVGTRAFVPSFWEIDEERHIFELDALHPIGKTDVGLGLRYELTDNDNSRNMRRRPLEPAQDRFLTQKDGLEADLFNVHASTETRLNERLRFTTGASYTTMDTDISGSRIYGAGYDPIYDPMFARRQQRDEGFFGLHGGSTLQQYLANLNLMWTPFDGFTVVPGLRIEKQDLDSESEFIETNVGAPPALPSTQEELAAETERGILDVAESIEFRYSGVTNWVFYARGNWMQGQGDLEEVETFGPSTNRTVDLLRDTDFDRSIQKYAVGANWYPLRSVNMGAQYYHKIRNEDYDHMEDTTTNRSGNRYPAFLLANDFVTDDVNFRITYRPWRNVTLVSRYDFQYSTVENEGDGLEKIESAKITSHIFSQSVSWTPWHRLFLTASANYAMDETDTPASDALGITNVVPDLKNNYLNLSAGAGLALDDKTDLQVNYFYYLADNYVDNSLYSMPYGADSQEHAVTVGLLRRFTNRIRWSIKYGFFRNDDYTSGGHNNYSSHLVYSTLRVMF
ncbi:MAG: hypothetical protein L0Y58_02860 [Verrucomicrobia subdivision 3 bacterium]|nr:hypothetical protein [Limisphaerales bacterium]